MSNLVEDKNYWRQTPYLRREPGDYTPFYVAIAICTVLGFFLVALNLFLYCSRYREYWCDHNTGNRWIIPLWTKTPANQPPLDLTELDEVWIPTVPEEVDFPDNYSEFEHHLPEKSKQDEFVELVLLHKSFQKKESDL